MLTLCHLLLLFAIGSAPQTAQIDVPLAVKAITPVPQNQAWWMERHQQKIAEAKAGGIDLLMIGDSITNNYDKPGPAPDEVFLPIWQEYFGPHHPMNLGFSADQTQHVLWRLDHGEVDGLTPHNIVVLIGTNNTGWNKDETAEEATAGIVAVLEELHRLMPMAKITNIDILPSNVSPAKSATDAAINAAVTAHYAGSSYVKCLDLGYLFMKNGVLNSSLFYDPKLTPPRGALHPNTVGQRMMAQAVVAAVYH